MISLALFFLTASVALAADPLDAFLTPRPASRAVNTTALGTKPDAATAADCAQACLDLGTQCVSFNFDPCELNGYGRAYVVVADAAQITNEDGSLNLEKAGDAVKSGGLPLAMEIARAHSGNIQVESPETGGSIFRILLPLSSAARRGSA